MNRLRSYLTRSAQTRTRPAMRRVVPAHAPADLSARDHQSLPTIPLSMR